jgi:hypothetical protein
MVNNVNKLLALRAGAAAVAATAVVGGTLTALNINTEDGVGAAQAGITLKNIGVTISNIDSISTDVETVYPNADWVNENNHIINSSENAYPVYVKVVIDHNWKDNDGNYVESSDIDDSVSDTARLYVGDSYDTGRVISDVASESDAYTVNDWIVFYSDAEQTVMYYTKPVAAGEQTTGFLDGIYFSDEMGNSFIGTSYSIDITVTAVQSDSGKDAMAAELGVFPSIDGSGVITSISESSGD